MVIEKYCKKNLIYPQIKYVKGSQPGHGLVFYGDIILPFEDDFPENTIMFQLLNTDPAKRKIPANLN